jgi:hypothetical protein
MDNLNTCVTDRRGRLWVSNGRQVKIFQVNQNNFVERWQLPNRRWKHNLTKIWRDHLLVSDWDGSLYQFNGQSRDADRPLYQAKADDVPIHRLAVGPDGQLVAAAWSGAIRTWDKNGESVNGEDALVVPHLPTHLMPLGGGSVGVADQARFLRLYDASGREAWSWQAEDMIHAAWAYEDRGQRAFLVQVGRQRFVRIVAGTPASAEQELFDTPVVSLSRRAASADDSWAVIAREGGKIDWLSASPFGVARDNSVTTGFEIRDILAVYDVQRGASLLALGVTLEGCLFTVCERNVSLYSDVNRIDRLVLDPTGRFVFLLVGDRIMVCQNPVVQPAACAVALVSVAGSLAVNAFHKVTATLKNTGPIAIHEVRAELHADTLIDPSKNKRALSAPVWPGESFDLEFSVRARAAGLNVPLRMRLEMTDEKGPPMTVVEIGFDIESRAS